MDEDRADHSQPRSRARLLERLDKLVEVGRVTEQEAERLRAAEDSGAFDDAVREIRLRHARASLDDAVAGGRLTQAEAAALLERVRNGEHSGVLRDLVRGAPPKDRRRRIGRHRGDAHG